MCYKLDVNPIFYQNQDCEMNGSDDDEDYFSIICDTFMIFTPKVKDIYCVYDALLCLHQFIQNSLKLLPMKL